MGVLPRFALRPSLLLDRAIWPIQVLVQGADPENEHHVEEDTNCTHPCHDQEDGSEAMRAHAPLLRVTSKACKTLHNCAEE